ncbi:hypothetical protein LDENG_00236790, partial [Lucifuga dentata]
ISKNSDVYDLNNYHPISKLPCLAKILESLVNDHLKSFLTEHSVLNPHQSGFRSKHSTITAATVVINDISSVDNGKDSTALFIDLSKAFDTVDHSLLLSKLHSISFNSNAYRWFQDYLSNRKQSVFMGNVHSNFLSISKDVPQGTIPGPILFSIYINNITSCLTECKFHLYADDTILYCFADSVQLAAEKLQHSFNIIQDALFNHKLVLNVNKTKFMIFSRAKDTEYKNIHISTVSGSSIERVSEYKYKYLGILVDEKFTFKSHIESLVSKLRQKIGLIYRNGTTLLNAE